MKKIIFLLLLSLYSSHLVAQYEGEGKNSISTSISGVFIGNIEAIYQLMLSKNMSLNVGLGGQVPYDITENYANSKVTSYTSGLYSKFGMRFNILNSYDEIAGFIGIDGILSGASNTSTILTESYYSKQESYRTTFSGTAAAISGTAGVTLPLSDKTLIEFGIRYSAYTKLSSSLPVSMYRQPGLGKSNTLTNSSSINYIGFFSNIRFQL